MNKSNVNIFWFRRDLRLEDNVGLYHALNSDLPVLLVFIFDKNILDKLPENDPRVNFIYNTLESLNTVLSSYNSSIKTVYGTPEEAFLKLVENYKINHVYCNKDYEPYGISRDTMISKLLADHNISFSSFKDHVIFEENNIVKDDGNPYKVYTPYSKKWLQQFKELDLKQFSSEKHLNNLYPHQHKAISLKEIGFKTSSIKVMPYEVNYRFIIDYENTRNFPALDSTSRLGPHLRFGTISIRKIVLVANEQENKTFLKELIWREFFIQILWHYPHTITKAFKPQYDRIEWRNAPEDFKRWCNGETGYPLVDAGMRQLNETGFMHNRVRMLVGSFLCKHLLLDWRLGEAYFAEKLLDYELASNVGNWQWVAGCGVDAAPYFRIFNPTTQVQKFDKELKYIKRWVPEFQELTYPNQIVDHKFARERCLKTYQSALR